MTYFRHDAPLAPGQTVELRGEEARHLLQARRMRRGERFALQDPAGHRFAAELIESGRGTARAVVGEAIAVPSAPAVAVTLLQAAIKDKAVEVLIEKCTELGAAGLAFFPGEHSTVAHKALAAPRLRERWERIAWEACKQCDRAAPPTLTLWPDLAAALAAHPAGPEAQGWVLAPGAAQRAAEAIATRPRQVHVLVGPEGGLTPAEVAQAEAAGYRSVRLGETVLRAETAALAACALAVLG